MCALRRRLHTPPADRRRRGENEHGGASHALTDIRRPCMLDASTVLAITLAQQARMRVQTRHASAGPPPSAQRLDLDRDVKDACLPVKVCPEAGAQELRKPAAAPAGGLNSIVLDVHGAPTVCQCGGDGRDTPGQQVAGATEKATPESCLGHRRLRSQTNQTDTG